MRIIINKGFTTETIYDNTRGNKMKQADFYSEIARVMRLCEGTNLNYGDLVRYGETNITCDHDFMDKFSLKWNSDKFKFALTIVEGRPVFIGDILYHDIQGKVKVYATSTQKNFLICKKEIDNKIDTPFLYDLNMQGISWKEAKKTFILNGKEIPCSVNWLTNYSIKIEDKVIFFNSKEEVLEVKATLIEIFSENKIVTY